MIATHSLTIIAYSDACTHVLGPDGIRETPYLKTEHYSIMREFMSNVTASLDELLSD